MEVTVLCTENKPHNGLFIKCIIKDIGKYVNRMRKS